MTMGINGSLYAAQGGVTVYAGTWPGLHIQCPVSQPSVLPSRPSPLPISHLSLFPPTLGWPPSGKEETKIPNPGDIQNNGQDL